MLRCSDGTAEPRPDPNQRYPCRGTAASARTWTRLLAMWPTLQIGLHTSSAARTAASALPARAAALARTALAAPAVGAGAWTHGAWAHGAWTHGAWTHGAWTHGAWTHGAWTHGGPRRPLYLLRLCPRMLRVQQARICSDALPNQATYLERRMMSMHVTDHLRHVLHPRSHCLPSPLLGAGR